MHRDAAETPLEVPTANLDAAEPPLEGEEADWLKRQRLLLAARRARVKHSFVHLRLAASWLTSPLHIDVNELLQVSCNGGNWHGSADFYIDDDNRSCWRLKFHWDADIRLMKTTEYKQIENTGTYLSIESGTSNQWNSMLVVKPL